MTQLNKDLIHINSSNLWVLRTKFSPKHDENSEDKMFSKRKTTQRKYFGLGRKGGATRKWDPAGGRPLLSAIHLPSTTFSVFSSLSALFQGNVLYLRTNFRLRVLSSFDVSLLYCILLRVSFVFVQRKLWKKDVFRLEHYIYLLLWSKN